MNKQQIKENINHINNAIESLKQLGAAEEVTKETIKDLNKAVARLEAQLKQIESESESKSLTILEKAKQVFGEQLNITNKAVLNKIATEKLKDFYQSEENGKMCCTFTSDSKTLVDGCEFTFSVSSRFIKKTGTYKLVFDH